MAGRSEVGDPSWGWVGMFCCEQELAPGFRREHGEERGETVVGVDRRNRLAFVPPLRVLLVLPWFPARPPPPRNFNLSERRRLFLPPWLCGPTVPLMRAETRVGCAVCMPSRVGPQSQGKAARPSMRTFVLGFPLWAFGRERASWLAGSCCWADGTREQDNGQGRLKAGPLFLSRPLRPSRRSLFRGFL